MTSEEISSPPLILPPSKIEQTMSEEDLSYRTELMKIENQYLENVYDNDKKHLENLMQCDNLKKQQIYFKTEFKKLNDYSENLKEDMIVIKDQHNSLGEKLEAIKKQDVQMNDLIISNKEHDVKIEKIQFEHDAKVEALKKICLQKELVDAEIFQLQNILIEKRNRKIKFQQLQAEIKEEEEKKIEKERNVKELREKLKSLRNLRVKKDEEHEEEMNKKKLKMEDLKLKIEGKKNKAKQLEEFQEILKTLEDKEKSELDDRQRFQAEQKSQLEKLEEQLKSLEKKLEISSQNYETFCESINIKFISFKNLENMEIGKILQNLEQNIRDKEIEFVNVEKNLIDCQNKHKDEYQIKMEKVEETKNLLKIKHEKNQEEKKILEELREKIIDTRKKIDEQIHEKQRNVESMENATLKKNELKKKINELKDELSHEKENIVLIENMKKDVLEVNKHVEEALEFRKNLIQDEEELKEQSEEKIQFIEKRIVEGTKDFDERTLAFEMEISKNAKLIAQMKREVKKRDNKEMKKERGLREKLSRLQEEIKKCKIENEKKYESFDIMEVDLLEGNKSENLKSILKSPSLKKETSLEVKSPRKVQFDIESDDSLLSLYPLTQKPQSP